MQYLELCSLPLSCEREFQLQLPVKILLTDIYQYVHHTL